MQYLFVLILLWYTCCDIHVLFNYGPGDILSGDISMSRK